MSKPVHRDESGFGAEPPNQDLLALVRLLARQAARDLVAAVESAADRAGPPAPTPATEHRVPMLRTGTST